MAQRIIDIVHLLHTVIFRYQMNDVCITKINKSNIPKWTCNAWYNNVMNEAVLQLKFQSNRRKALAVSHCLDQYGKCACVCVWLALCAYRQCLDL